MKEYKIKFYNGFEAKELWTPSEYSRKFIISDRTIPLGETAVRLYKFYFGVPKFLGEYCSITYGADYKYYEIDGMEYVEIFDDIF